MTGHADWCIHHYDSVSSTMDVAGHHARHGAPDRTVVVSAAQTAGRGRSERPWRSPAGVAVYCTMILRPCVTPDRLSTLPLVAGVAVAEAIEQVVGHPVQVKWPNDIWIGTDPKRRKVAGILMTSSLRGGNVDRVLVGIGINVSSQPDDLPPGATSLVAATGIKITPDAVFRIVLDRFDHAYEAFLEARGKPSLDGWRARAALLGESVTIEDAGRRHEGDFVGIDDDGALLLYVAGSGVRKVVAGDLTRGPRGMPAPGRG